MKNCPICNKQIEDWETLCNKCWKNAKEAFQLEKIANGELVERLKAKAKEDLLELMRELCKKCEHFSSEISNDTCSTCAWKEKEKLLRAFVE